jgi:hypothetical protein
MQINACAGWGSEPPGEPRPPLLSRPFMIADFLADYEYLAHVLLVLDSQKVRKLK